MHVTDSDFFGNAREGGEEMKAIKRAWEIIQNKT